MNPSIDHDRESSGSTNPRGDSETIVGLGETPDFPEFESQCLAAFAKSGEETVLFPYGKRFALCVWGIDRILLLPEGVDSFRIESVGSNGYRMADLFDLISWALEPWEGSGMSIDDRRIASKRLLRPDGSLVPVSSAEEEIRENGPFVPRFRVSPSPEDLAALTMGIYRYSDGISVLDLKKRVWEMECGEKQLVGPGSQIIPLPDSWGRLAEVSNPNRVGSRLLRFDDLTVSEDGEQVSLISTWAIREKDGTIIETELRETDWRKPRLSPFGFHAGSAPLFCFDGGRVAVRPNGKLLVIDGNSEFSTIWQIGETRSYLVYLTDGGNIPVYYEEPNEKIGTLVTGVVDQCSGALTAHP